MRGADQPDLSTDVHLPHVWATHARFNGDRTALVCGDRRVSWAEFNQGMNRVANALIARGIGRGDRVAVVMTNSIEMMEVLFGIVKAGACVVPLSGLLTRDQLSTLLADSGAIALFASASLHHLVAPLPHLPEANLIAVSFAADGWTGFDDAVRNQPAAEPVVDYAAGDPFNIIYSSGTTGLPKGIVQAHRARLHWSWSNGLAFGFDRHSVALVTTSLYSNGTWFMVLPPMLTGATIVIMEQFSSSGFLDIVARERVTHSFMVPTQFIALLDDPGLDAADLSSLKMLLSAGSPLRQVTRAAAEARICPRIFELYGFSEGFATVIDPADAAVRPGSVGKPVIGFDLRIIDDDGREVEPGVPGEIAGTGGGMMTGYHGRPDLTDAMVWQDALGRRFLRSGDIGALDADGYLTILDRKKDMILSGGFNIFPADLEEVVARHPDVVDVTVIGIPHPRWGETPIALVIPRQNADPVAIVEWANERLAKTQRLQRVEFREAFPRNALGKVLKRELRAPYWERAD